jgi:hypothetical protein
LENDIISFKNDIQEAILGFGARNVYNMDETPEPTVNFPTTGWNTSHHQLTLFTDGNDKQNVTIIPTISATGAKLPLVFINNPKQIDMKKQ